MCESAVERDLGSVISASYATPRRGPSYTGDRDRRVRLDGRIVGGAVGRGSRGAPPSTGGATFESAAAPERRGSGERQPRVPLTRAPPRARDGITASGSGPWRTRA